LARDPERRPSYISLLKNRAFSYLWVGQLVSQSGDAVFDVALLWLVLATTGSTALVGLTQAAVLVPIVLASPVAGVYADRTNRRNLMIVSSVIQGIITAAFSVLYLTNSLNFSLLILLVLLLYTGAQFYRAANSAIIPRIVTREDLGAANGLFALSQSANQLVGYTAGGIIILALGVTVPITYDSLTFFFAAAVLTLISKSYGQPRPPSPGSTADRPRFWDDFREGLHYLRQSMVFLQLVFFGLLINFFGGALVALLAPYAKLSLHGDASTYGFLLSSFALGTITGSILIGKVNFRHYVGRLLFFGAAVFGALFALIGLVTSVPAALTVFFAMGMTLACVNIPISTLVQTQIPGELLGRATTALGALLSAAQPIAAVLAGTLAGLTSIGSVFLGSGVAVVVLSFGLYPFFEKLRRASY